MTIDKIYQDNVIAGAAIRDGKGKRIDTNYLSINSLDSALEGKNITTQGNTFNQADTLLKLNSEGKVDSTVLPETVTATPNTATGLSITKVSDTSFSVSAGYCVDTTNVRVLNLDNTITKTISIFSEGNNGGSLSSVSGDLIPKLTENTSNLILDGSASRGWKVFDKDETGSYYQEYTLSPANSIQDRYIGYTFDTSLPAGTYEIYMRASSDSNNSYTFAIQVSVIYTDGSEEVVLSEDWLPSSPNYTASIVVLNDKKVNINKPFNAIKFTNASADKDYASFKVYEATIKAPTVTTYSINIAEKEDGTADVFIGNNLPVGFTYMRSIGKIMLNDEGTAITDYFPKTDLATLFSNYDLATKDDIPAPYTLPVATTSVLGGVKVDNTTIGIDSNGVISSKVTMGAELLENSEDLNTLTVPNKTYYGTASSGCENLPVSNKSFHLQVLNTYNTTTDPAVVQQFISEDGEIYVRAYRYNTNWTPGSNGVGGEQPMGPEWTAWSKLATTSDVSTLTLDKVTMTDAALASAPSNKYDDLTLGATGEPYDAPESGWFFIMKATTASNQYVCITNTTNALSAYCDSSTVSRRVRTMLKVAKGDTVRVYYTAEGTLSYFRFYYDTGVVNETTSQTLANQLDTINGEVI